MANLIDQDNQGWDMHMLHTLFWEEDANIISQIPVGPVGSSDILVWHYTHSGYYSVKSAYYLARHLKRIHRQIHAPPSGSTESIQRNWGFIWKLKFQIKLRFSFGDFCIMFYRKILSESICPVCRFALFVVH